MSMISFCFFKQKTAYELRISDWSSDVCSSDLRPAERAGGILVDIGDVGAIALVRNIGVELAEIVDLEPRARRDRAAAIGERTHRPHVDRAAERLPDQRRVGGLVDDRAVQELRRIFDRKSTRLNSSH